MFFFTCVFIRYDMFDKYPVLQLIALSKSRLAVCIFSLFSVAVAFPHRFSTSLALGWHKKAMFADRGVWEHFFYKKQCRFQDLPNCQEEKTTRQSTEGNKRKMPWKNSRLPVCDYFLPPYVDNTPQNIFCWCGNVCSTNGGPLNFRMVRNPPGRDTCFLWKRILGVALAWSRCRWPCSITPSRCQHQRTPQRQTQHHEDHEGRNGNPCGTYRTCCKQFAGLSYRCRDIVCTLSISTQGHQ